jgi:hypothetical protein
LQIIEYRLADATLGWLPATAESGTGTGIVAVDRLSLDVGGGCFCDPEGLFETVVGELTYDVDDDLSDLQLVRLMLLPLR